LVWVDGVALGGQRLKFILHNRCGRDKRQCDCFVTKHNQTPSVGLKGDAGWFNMNEVWRFRTQVCDARAQIFIFGGSECGVIACAAKRERGRICF